MRRIGPLSILSLASLPIVLVIASLGDRPSGAASWIDLAGRLSGVLGLTCFLLAAAVSVRAPGFDRFFGGLTRLWRLHHFLGLAAFVLLLAHPPLMALARAPLSAAAVLEVLLPTGEAMPTGALWSGWLALLAMMLFLVPSFQLFGRPEYQRWKALHFASGVALVAGLAHTLPLTRSMPRAMAIAWWGSLGLGAAAVFAWRATLARRVLRRSYRIAERRPLDDDVTRLLLEPRKGEPLAHEPGQFVYLTPHDPGLAAGRGEEHPYTVSSPPGSPRLELTVKALGDASRALLTVAEGSAASVEGPYGDFLCRRFRDRPQLWIGGGIGITPFVSAARARAEGAEDGTDPAGPWGDTVLVNCANDPSRAHFIAILQDLAGRADGLSVIAHYFASEGPLDRTFLLACCPDAGSRHWLVCGPPALIELARRLARDLGVPRSRFHCEDFVFL